MGVPRGYKPVVFKLLIRPSLLSRRRVIIPVLFSPSGPVFRFIVIVNRRISQLMSGKLFAGNLAFGGVIGLKIGLIGGDCVNFRVSSESNFAATLGST